MRQKCGKVTDIVSELKLGKVILRTFKCGHSSTEKVVKKTIDNEVDEFLSLRWKAFVWFSKEREYKVYTRL